MECVKIWLCLACRLQEWLVITVDMAMTAARKSDVGYEFCYMPENRYSDKAYSINTIDNK